MQGLAQFDEEEDTRESWDVRLDRDWRAIEYAPESFRKDRDWMMKLCKVSGYAYEFADEDLRDEDWKLALRAVRNSNGESFKWIPKELHRNRELLLNCVEVNAHVLKQVTNKAYNDEEAKIKSVAGVFFCFRRGGKDGAPFPKGACTPQNGNQCGSCERFLEDPENCPLPQDREFIRNALAKNWMALKYADKELRNERDIVLQAVQSGGFAYMYSSEELQADREVALEAVKQTWQVFQQLSRNFRADKEIAAAAVKGDWHTIKHFAKELTKDMELATQAVCQSWQAFEFLPKELRGKRPLAHEAVRQCWKAYQHTSKELKDDRDIALLAVLQNGTSLELCSETLRGDPEVAWAAVRQDVDALRFASEEIRSDEALVMEVVETDGCALRHAAENVKCKEQIVEAALDQEWMSTGAAVHPLFHEADGLCTEFWGRHAGHAGIEGRLRPAVSIVV